MKLLTTLALLASATLAAQGAVAPADAFASIKKLRGDWRGPAMVKGMPPSRSVFRVTAGGSAVEETIFPGSKMEMVSLYHMDKGNLLMTHYCAIGNQPRMKLNSKKSTPEVLVFDFDGGTNLNPRRDQHMRTLRLTLPTPGKDADTLHMDGTSFNAGKEQPGCAMKLTRRK